MRPPLSSFSRRVDPPSTRAQEAAARTAAQLITGDSGSENSGPQRGHKTARAGRAPEQLEIRARKHARRPGQVGHPHARAAPARAREADERRSRSACMVDHGMRRIAAPLGAASCMRRVDRSGRGCVYSSVSRKSWPFLAGWTMGLEGAGAVPLRAEAGTEGRLDGGGAADVERGADPEKRSLRSARAAHGL